MTYTSSIFDSQGGIWKGTSENTSKNKSTCIIFFFEIFQQLCCIAILQENTMRFYINSIKHKIEYIYLA